MVLPKRHATALITGAKGSTASGFQTKTPSTSKVKNVPVPTKQVKTKDTADRVSKKPGEKMQKANYTE